MNPQRGEIALEIEGETYTLCLTLGALAEIEGALGCESLKDLTARLKAISARDLSLLLAALLRGGGAPGMAARISEAAISPKRALEAVLACFREAAP